MQKLGTRKGKPISLSRSLSDAAALPGVVLKVVGFKLHWDGAPFRCEDTDTHPALSTLSGLMLAGGNFRNPRRFGAPLRFASLAGHA